MLGLQKAAIKGSDELGGICEVQVMPCLEIFAIVFANVLGLSHWFEIMAQLAELHIGLIIVEGNHGNTIV